MERMFDPDVEDMEEALSMVNHYEWAIGNDIGVQTQWMNVHEFSFPNATYVSSLLENIVHVYDFKGKKIHQQKFNYKRKILCKEISNDTSLIYVFNSTCIITFLISNLNIKCA